jgi:hypothetical protein
MLRFILAIMMIGVLLKVARDNPYVGFGLWLFFALSFMIYTNNIVDRSEIKNERDLLKTFDGRKQCCDSLNSTKLNYYMTMNSK